jgi:hypothetical protein
MFIKRINQRLHSCKSTKVNYIQTKKRFTFKQSFKVVLDFFKRNLSIFISLLALSVTLNNARITSSNQKLDQLYKNSTTYISNLNKLDLIITYKNERTTSVKKEEIDINVSNDTLYELIVHSINTNNENAKDLAVTLENIKQYHELERDRLYKLFYLSNLKYFKESGDSTQYTEEQIKNTEMEIRNIEKNQEDVKLAESQFSSILSKYYDEEEELNRFKLFYFF